MSSSSDFIDDQFSIEEDAVCCKNCSISSEDFFAIIGEKGPDTLNFCNAWYCSEECYEEDTINEG